MHGVGYQLSTGHFCFNMYLTIFVISRGVENIEMKCISLKNTQSSFVMTIGRGEQQSKKVLKYVMQLSRTVLASLLYPKRVALVNNTQ